jgi:hypothetical protein
MRVMECVMVWWCDACDACGVVMRVMVWCAWCGGVLCDGARGWCGGIVVVTRVVVWHSGAMCGVVCDGMVARAVV